MLVGRRHLLERLPRVHSLHPMPQGSDGIPITGPEDGRALYAEAPEAVCRHLSNHRVQGPLLGNRATPHRPRLTMLHHEHRCYPTFILTPTTGVIEAHLRDLGLVLGGSSMRWVIRPPQLHKGHQLQKGKCVA